MSPDQKYLSDFNLKSFQTFIVYILFLQKYQALGVIVVIYFVSSIINIPKLQRFIGDNRLLNALVFGFHNLYYSLICFILIFSCNSARQGILNRFLSDGKWIPISELCFGIYLVSPSIQFLIGSLTKRFEFHIDMKLMVRFFYLFI